MKTTAHPFFCKKKQCRKTAWVTPEYMSQNDWLFLKQIIDILENGTAIQLYDLLWDKQNQTLTKNFFNHTIGWPEGHTYCLEESYVVKTAFAGLKTHDLPLLKNAYADYCSN